MPFWNIPTEAHCKGVYIETGVYDLQVDYSKCTCTCICNINIYTTRMNNNSKKLFDYVERAEGIAGVVGTSKVLPL